MPRRPLPRSESNLLSRLGWKLLKIPGRLPYALGIGRLSSRLILLLTTIGRRSGKDRTTPLQYEEVEGRFYVASARGPGADWLLNIQANPGVIVRIGNRVIQGQAEIIRDPERIADFLQLRLERRPRMVGAILRADGLPSRPTRKELEQYGAGKPLAVIHPDPDAGNAVSDREGKPPGPISQPAARRRA